MLLIIEKYILTLKYLFQNLVNYSLPVYIYTIQFFYIKGNFIIYPLKSIYPRFFFPQRDKYDIYFPILYTEKKVL